DHRRRAKRADRSRPRLRRVGSAARRSRARSAALRRAVSERAGDGPRPVHSRARSRAIRRALSARRYADQGRQVREACFPELGREALPDRRRLAAALAVPTARSGRASLTAAGATMIVAGAVARRPGAGGHAWVFLQWL